jgi:uncharacterized alpha-E superfamily protein
VAPQLPRSLIFQFRKVTRDLRVPLAQQALLEQQAQLAQQEQMVPTVLRQQLQSELSPLARQVLAHQ